MRKRSSEVCILSVGISLACLSGCAAEVETPEQTEGANSEIIAIANPYAGPNWTQSPLLGGPETYLGATNIRYLTGHELDDGPSIVPATWISSVKGNDENGSPAIITRLTSAQSAASASAPGLLEPNAAALQAVLAAIRTIRWAAPPPA